MSETNNINDGLFNRTIQDIPIEAYENDRMIKKDGSYYLRQRLKENAIARRDYFRSKKSASIKHNTGKPNTYKLRYKRK